MKKSPSTSSRSTSQMDELDDLSQKLSNIAIQPGCQTSATTSSQTGDQSELAILEGIRGIIEKLNI